MSLAVLYYENGGGVVRFCGMTALKGNENPADEADIREFRTCEKIIFATMALVDNVV